MQEGVNALLGESPWPSLSPPLGRNVNRPGILVEGFLQAIRPALNQDDNNNIHPEDIVSQHLTDFVQNYKDNLTQTSV